jgi:L-ascorbate metabolism protein UlaG (beta-lactamase superfamily)
MAFFSAPAYRGPRSDHFDGKKFHNQQKGGAAGFGDFLKWARNRQQAPWREWTDIPPGPPPPRRLPPGELRATFVGHSTVLLQFAGLNILTDPVWSQRVSPVSWSGPRRHHPPGIRFEDLPPIDIILLSHNHYDHCDAETLARLAREHGPRIYTPLGNSAFLQRLGVGNSTDMDWWDELDIEDGVRLTCVPAEHFSGRGLSDRNMTLWGGFVIESPAGRIYFAGDTGFGPQFEQIARKFSPFRFALLPIGAFRPRWFMSSVHMGPDEAVVAHTLLGISRSMGIHFGTFALADDGEDEPIELLNSTLDQSGIPRENFFTLQEGEGRDLPPFQPD